MNNNPIVINGNTYTRYRVVIDYDCSDRVGPDCPRRSCTATLTFYATHSMMH
jgi:hypothetical protein